MVKGLKLLSQADPFVEVFQQQTGEWVILVAGELHLEVFYFLYAVIAQNLRSRRDALKIYENALPK